MLVSDPIINRAVKWAKVNILREEKLYPNGYGFTNDPPQDILVVRDRCLVQHWVRLHYSAVLLEGMLRLTQQYGVEETGELTEYLLACETPPTTNNYGLNINDDTPLFIFAVHHHLALSGDMDFLRICTRRSSALPTGFWLSGGLGWSGVLLKSPTPGALLPGAI